MKIAFVHAGYRLSYGNGIVSQALTWKKGLEQLGHEVVLCSNWDYYPLEDFDAIQCFGFNENLIGLIQAFRKKNKNIFIAPILDPDYSILNAKIRAHYGSSKLRLYSKFSVLHDVRKIVKGVMVRSSFEKEYMVNGFGYAPEICNIVKLPSGITPKYPFAQKKPYCLHISLLADDRKNVKRLIEASSKYNFKLILAGTLRNRHEENKFYSWIKDKSNIEYKGWVTEEQKEELYKQARVFALPSINEGVGIVALEAACYGADVVITDIGGPKEYYGDYALKVNPYDIDAIGKAVSEFIHGKTYQPHLAQYIEKNCSLAIISKQLEMIYSKQ